MPTAILVGIELAMNSEDSDFVPACTNENSAPFRYVFGPTYPVQRVRVTDDIFIHWSLSSLEVRNPHLHVGVGGRWRAAVSALED